MAPLPTRQLGKNGPKVTALGFGLMGLSTFYGTVGSEEERLAFLDHLYASGERFWDTADMYGDSEDLLGRWFKQNPGKRETIFLATKFGNTPSRGIRSDPAYALEACDKSLQRLGIETIDLYYIHRVDKITPIEDTMEALVQLKEQGKIKYMGISEVSADTLARAHAVHPISALQIEYSPWSLDIEHADVGLLKTCKELGIAVVAYSPLGRGFLTGQIRSPDDFEEDDFRKFSPRFSAANFGKNLKLVDELAAVAKAKGCTPGQLSLAWLLRQWEMVIPIPGTKRTKYFDENLGALEVQLTDEEDRKIRQAIESTEITGGRYPAAFGGNLLADTPLPKK